MKAIVLNHYGGPENLRLAERSRPVPKENEILIRVISTTVTAGDCELRAMRLPMPFRIPLRAYFAISKTSGIILGQEVSGVVEAVGKNVSAFMAGDHVVASTMLRLGGYAEYVCLPAKFPIMKKPAELTFDESATLVTGGLNAVHFLKMSRLKEGQKLLINGAGGSIGTYAIQIARAMGAEVTAVDSAEKHDMLQRVGANHVIDYKSQNFTLMDKTWDVVLDIVGTCAFDATLARVNPGGFYILGNPRIGGIVRAMFANRKSDRRVEFQFAGYTIEDRLELLAWVAKGVIRPVIDRTYPLEQVADAHAYVDSGRKAGNVIIRVGSEHGLSW